MNKPILLLLHGALADKSQFDSLIPRLNDGFDVHTINFEGHGDLRATDRPFRIKYFAQNVLAYLSERDIKKVNIFGYSMGGYVALTLTKNHPKRIEKIATLGTVLQWDEEKAESECRYLNPDKIMKKVPHFATGLEKQHKCGWETMVNKTSEMLHCLGKKPDLKKEDWPGLRHSIRLYVGDRDTTAGLEETVKIYRKIKQSELCVLPDTAHPFKKINKEILAKSLLKYFVANK